MWIGGFIVESNTGRTPNPSNSDDLFRILRKFLLNHHRNLCQFIRVISWPSSSCVEGKAPSGVLRIVKSLDLPASIVSPPGTDSIGSFLSFQVLNQ